MRTRSIHREQNTRLQDDSMLLEAKRVVSRSTQGGDGEYGERYSMNRARSHHGEPADAFDEAINPLHEKTVIYQPPESPSTKLAALVKNIHQSSFVVRYLTYIVPMALILLIPLLVGGLEYPNSSVGGVELMWENKWRDMAKQLEVHFALFLWWLAVEISFLPTMKNHHVDGEKTTRSWENTLNKIIIVVLVWKILNLIEKFVIQAIAISFHQRTYADRIETNKFQIGSLTKLRRLSQTRFGDEDEAFKNNSNTQTFDYIKSPLKYATQAGVAAQRAVTKAGNKFIADFTGRQPKSSSDPYQIILMLLRSTSGCQGLARRLYRTFVRDGFDKVFSSDLKEAFDNHEEAEAAFSMFDRDLNGDISMDELEAACVDIGRERKSITASLKGLDSVISKLDQVVMFFVFVIVLLVFLSLISTSAAGVLTSAGSTILGLSWLFSTTATEFLQSIIFVFVKHPFDVGDRVTIYGNSGDVQIMQGHVLQAPNSYLNALYILNQRRSGALAEAVPIVIKYGTSIEQIEELRRWLLEFVRSEKRDFQSDIATELREVTENFSVTLNIVFFYKSNWQNEGLRLLRRKKIICMLMTTLQEIGIEGPRMNLQGYKLDTPFHVHYSDWPTRELTKLQTTQESAKIPIGESSESAVISTGSGARSDSILRQGMDTAAARSRGQPHSRKHVDFSLGMSDFISNDIMGDVFDDRINHIDDVVRTANRESTQRCTRDVAEAEEESCGRDPSRRSCSLESSSLSQDRRPSIEIDALSTCSGTLSTQNSIFRPRNSASHRRGDLESGRSVSPIPNTGED
ncbi:hypothetical protein N7481_008480 [Penicillium waksmanii]|uniref:uncharacterized protein n=1 Tax=Penicillium waksmanii TaxID=69791 RepID=UPI0025498454|nr:uncharacterized protein N7481_008480 [Penicillium waksmanii]KAJ5974773.1 hypothetical protein N7481_008480 [Penicillium waksmanii]